MSVKVRLVEKRSVVGAVEVTASIAQFAERMAASIFAVHRHTVHEVVYVVEDEDGVAGEAAEDIDNSAEVVLAYDDAWEPALASVAYVDVALVHDVEDQVASVLEGFLEGEVHMP